MDPEKMEQTTEQKPEEARIELPEKIKIKLAEGRSYRPTSELLRAMSDDEEGKSKKVEGYACTFNQTYELYNDGEYIVEEEIDARAFDDCDMSDVIMQYDHEGRVFARTGNDTLSVSADDMGLKIGADLTESDGGPGLYRDIKGGFVTKMSFGFSKVSDERTYKTDSENNTYTVHRLITKIGKLYDVSAVSIPANDTTEISARSLCDGLIAEAKQEQLEMRAEHDRLQAECLALLSL